LAGTRQLRIAFLVTALIPGLFLCGCRDSGGDETHPAIAVTSTYFESAVRDIAGSEVRVLTLMPPGGCPGHFDVRPSQVEQLRKCRLLVRFDFQGFLDKKFADVISSGLKISEVKISGGLCQPEAYLSSCKQVGQALIKAGLIDAETVKARSVLVEDRMIKITRWAKEQIRKAGLNGHAVIASEHQASFCNWLGLDVVATFPSADTVRFSQMNEAIKRGQKAHIGMVVGNLSEGRQTADAIAERLGARVVVFGNFPIPGKAEPTFDDLFHENVKKLIRASDR